MQLFGIRLIGTVTRQILGFRPTVVPQSPAIPNFPTIAVPILRKTYGYIVRGALPPPLEEILPLRITLPPPPFPAEGRGIGDPR